MAIQSGKSETVEPVDRGTWKRLKKELPVPPRREDREDLLWQEFAAQFGWYDRAATRNRVSYQILKLTTLIVGAAVTVLAAISAPAALTASLAAVIVVVEGAQQMFQFHPNWLSYRRTAESLRQHAFFYAAEVAPYDDSTLRRDRLAAILKDLTAGENANWAQTMKQGGSRVDTVVGS